jgi:hypothetical protein
MLIHQEAQKPTDPDPEHWNSHKCSCCFFRKRGRRGSAHHQASIFGQTFQPHSWLGEDGAQSEYFYFLETSPVTRYRYGCRLDYESRFKLGFLWRKKIVTSIKLMPMCSCFIVYEGLKAPGEAFSPLNRTNSFSKHLYGF